MHTYSSDTAQRVVAILRGLTPGRAVEIGSVLKDAGIRTLEVPLNSPHPFASIRALRGTLPEEVMVGAGTVLSAEDVRRTHEAGGRLVVAPNCDPEVITTALQLGMRVLPGVGTATECFTALRAGARELKLFPAASYGPAHLKALREVLPSDVGVWPVGGVTATDVDGWLKAGAAGFGFGGEIFRPTFASAEIGARARHVLQMIDNNIRGGTP
ncbi:MAG: 2-dehydro-3-deoxy-6-phosphogalactonate aldolase [Steroidobacteraceae bacterium]